MTESGQNKRVNTSNYFVINNLEVNIVSIIGPIGRILRGAVQGVVTCARPALVLTRTLRVGIGGEMVTMLIVLRSSSVGRRIMVM